MTETRNALISIDMCSNRNEDALPPQVVSDIGSLLMLARA